jgi:hypothetical protein
MSISGGPFPEHYNPGPIGRCSLQMQGSPAGSVTGPSNTTGLGAEEARFQYIPPPAPFATHNYSGSAYTGYRKWISLPRHICAFADQLTIYFCSAFHRTITSFPALNPAYRLHPHHPVSTTSPIKPPSSVPMLPSQRPSIAFNAGYCGQNPPSIQHDIRLSPQVQTKLGFPYPSPKPPYHVHHGPPAQAQARLLPQSAGLCTYGQILPNFSSPSCAGNTDANFFPLSTSSLQLFGVLSRDGSVQGPIF